MEFTLKEVVEIVRKRLVLITISTLVGIIMFFVFSKFIIKPTYTASVLMYVDYNDSTSSANLNELNYAQKVVTTYINFLQTQVFYKQVVDESNLEYSPKELMDMTQIESISNTEIFQISVTSPSPDDSFELVELMQKIAPELIKSIKGTAQIRIVDPVVIPMSPSSPNIGMNTLVGGVMGLIVSILGVFMWEIIDINVKSKEDLLNRYELPILGAIPNFNVYKKRNYKLQKLFPSLRNNNKQLTNLIDNIDNKTKFVITEAYKSFRINLRFTLHSDECKKVLISSPNPQDGKSTISANLAITIAETGARVLLIDCDLRKGRVHTIFHLKNAPGLSDTLSGMINVSYVIRKTNFSNLQLITMGTIPPNPTELLASVQMEELIKRLSMEYDYIILDTPPVNVVSDPLSLVKMVDGVVIVVRENMTSHPSIVSSVTKYEFVEAKILGFVVNGITLNQREKSSTPYYNNYNKNG